MGDKCDICGRTTHDCETLTICSSCMAKIQGAIERAKDVASCKHDFRPVKHIGYFACARCGEMKYDLSSWVKEVILDRR